MPATASWTYVDAPESVPAPSYRYWMPLTSVLAAVGMALTAGPDSFQTAQFLFILATAGAVAYLLALMLGGARRHAWVAGLLTVMGATSRRVGVRLIPSPPMPFLGRSACC
ncbi:MAG: hypothetical protein OXE52_01355 [Chloroflexi bacterium]|nr:hypothetical protein [Chloroflexota bacterium]